MDHCRATETISIWDLQRQNSGHAAADEEGDEDRGSRSCELGVKNWGSWGRELQSRPCVRNGDVALLLFGRSASCEMLCASMLQFCFVASHDVRFGVALAPTQPHATFMFRCAGMRALR